MVFIIVGVIVLLYLLGFWFVHIGMVREEAKVYGWGTFFNFIKEFKKYKWDKFDGHNKTSFFKNYCTSKQSQIHAWIIQFNGVGMILDPISFYIFLAYISIVGRGRIECKCFGVWK